MAVKIKRGDVVLVKLDPVIGSEEGKTRPAVIIQNDTGNEYSPTTIIAPVTSRVFSKKFPTNVEIDSRNSPLKEKSTVLLNQVRTIDKSRIIKNYGSLKNEVIRQINEALINSLGIE
jgi:mRNA interferase MazF